MARFDSDTDSDHFWAIPRPIRFWQLLVDSFIDSLPLIRGCPKIGQQVPFVPEFTLNGARFKLKFDTDSNTDSRDGHDSIPIPIPIPGMGTIRYRFQGWARFDSDTDSRPPGIVDSGPIPIVSPISVIHSIQHPL